MDQNDEEALYHMLENPTFSTGSNSIISDCRHFLYFKNKLNGDFPRKDNFNLFLMRKIRNLINCINNSKIPSKSIIACKMTSRSQARIYFELTEIFNDNQTLMRNILDSRESIKTADINRFLSNNVIRKMFNKIIELVFMNLSPESLCEKFTFVCCPTRMHTNECIYMWTQFKIYLETQYMYELDGFRECPLAIDVNSSKNVLEAEFRDEDFSISDYLDD